MKICPQCNLEYQDNMKFCPECGSKLETKPNVCPNCGTEYKEGQKFCSECGANLVTLYLDLPCVQDPQQIELIFQEGEKYYSQGREGDNDPNYRKAFECFMTAAKADHADALSYLGMMYENGYGVIKDYAKSCEWYARAFQVLEKAVEHGDIKSMVSLGECYLSGKGVEKDEKKAIKLYTRAYKGGYLPAAVKLGLCCRYGWGVEQDTVKAVEYYTICAERGIPEAMRELGYCYDDGYGVKKNKVTAFKWYKKAAEAGDSDALFQIGLAYFYGNGVKADKSEAVKWYKKAAEKDSYCAYLIGECYRLGEGVEKNEDIAYEWYTKSSDLPEAMLQLGDYCLKNRNNFAEAFTWYNRVVHSVDYGPLECMDDDEENVITKAQQRLNKYFNSDGSLTSIALNIDETIKSTYVGDANALLKLGEYFLQLDMKEAMKYYKEAAKAGSTVALDVLVRLYAKEYDEIHGEWIEQDVDDMIYRSRYDVIEDDGETLEWLQKAAEKGNAQAAFLIGEYYYYGLGKAEQDLNDDDEFYDEELIDDELDEDELEEDELEEDQAEYWYIKAADAGYLYAIAKLAVCHSYGDYEKGIVRATKAAKLGSVRAMVRLGDLYHGLGEYEKAIHCYDKAILSEKTDKDVNLNAQKGDCYFDCRELARAIACYQQGEEEGECLALHRLGECCFWGLGMSQDFPQAYKYFKKCSESEHYYAVDSYLEKFFDQNGNIKEDMLSNKTFELEFRYKELIERPYHQKANKYEIAAKKGDANAQYELAKLLYYGLGVRWNREKALTLFQKAAEYYRPQAEKGDLKAQLILGDCARYGDKSEGAEQKALYWYKKAAEASMPEAQYALGDAYLHGIGTRVKKVKALSWFEKASLTGNIDAKYSLALMLSSSIDCKDVGKSVDYTASFALMQCAAEAGHSKAEYVLAEYYEKAKGTSKNVALALKWYKLAFENGNFDAWIKIRRLNKEIGKTNDNKDSIVEPIPSISSNEPNISAGSDPIEKCIPHVFFIKAVGFDITYPDGKRQQMKCGSSQGEIPSWSGTGFLLADGRFVTARHVVEAWSFPAGGGELDEGMVALNIVANNGGKVVAKFVAISSNGTQIQFTSDQCTINRRNDKVSLTDKGAKLVVANVDDTDYAYFHASRSYGLPHNNAASTTLARGAKLVVLGFPLGIGANSENDINPILGSGIVAAPGLQKGVILTTDTNYEQGNSGGPVFKANSNGDLEVIGLVSAGAGRTMGFIVPIAAVK